MADTFAIADFPDLRYRRAIRTDDGGIMFIPNLNNSLRIYTLLSPAEVSELLASEYDVIGDSQRRDNRKTIIGVPVERTKSLLHPFKFEITELEWVSITPIA